MLSGVEEISPVDLLATLNRFTAETIAEGIRSGLKLINQDAESTEEADPVETENRKLKTKTVQKSEESTQSTYEIKNVNPQSNSIKQIRVLISGGGAHNQILVKNLSDCLKDIQVSDFSSIGVHPDAKEALFFAAMANEFLCGNKFAVQREDGSSAHVSFGKLSFPD